VAEYTGELAALLTSVCWSFTSIFFMLSGRRVGSVVVNRTRLLFALTMVALLHWLTQGLPLPIHADASRWGWMALSGVIGFVIGDAFLFQAFVMIGARLSMLIMALNPVMGVVLAWVMLDETLSPVELLGILLAIGGVVWVISDRTNGASLPDTSRRNYVIGVLMALGGALGQASGLIFSKKGLEGDFSALSGNVMRLVVATSVIWGFTLLRGQVRPGIRSLREHPDALRFIFGGAVAGPFVGVWMSLIAVQHAAVGVASTLMSFAPVFLLVPAHFLFRERLTWRAILGTALAIAGTAILFLAA
jgi:drug/metabolite transporter (DMT)-like permease